MRIVITVYVVLLMGLFATAPVAAEPSSAIERTASTPGATLRILSPEDGAVVQNPVLVVFGLSQMGVAPAGVQHPGTGHHHLIIDAKLPAAGLPIPSDERHRHFGGGQTEVSLDLPPGKHTLQLLLGDHNHVPHDPPVASEPITITVR